MTCKCIAEFEKKLKAKHNTTMVSTGWLKLDVGYRPRKKDGTISQCWRYDGMDFVFCPFCGKKL